MLGHFEYEDDAKGSGNSTPIETAEAMFDAADHHFPTLEVAVGAVDDRAGEIEALLDAAAGMEDPASRALGRVWLRRYAEDAARLPLAVLRPAAQDADYDPARLMVLGRGDVALVLRRLASLPRSGTAAAPPFGLAVCDGSGALTFRRRLSAFSIPRFGPGCPLWPLYRALGRPGQPETAMIEMPQGARFRAWAVSQPLTQTGFGEAPVMQATMLMTPAPGATGPAIDAGPGCQLCPREACPARR
jgi:predicted transcriptional regulator